MDYYEILIIYDRECADVIVFQTAAIMNDANDIVSYAIGLELLDEHQRGKVWCARCISEYEYEYVVKI